MRLKQWPVLFGALALLLCSSGCSSAPAAGGELAGLTTQERERHVAGLQSLADHWGVSDPPQVEIIRWVLPEEADAARDPCLTEKGFDANPDGSRNVPAEQLESFNLAQYECFAAYPPIPRYAKAWGEDQIRAQYEWTVDHLVPCIESHGHIIGNIPSQEVFVETWETDPFFPFAQLSAAATSQVEHVCAQEAPSAVLWDGVSVKEWQAKQMD